MHWYRNGISRGADLLAANDIEREGLTLAQAVVRFRTTERTIARIRQRCRQVANVLTPQDTAVFTRLADGRRRRRIAPPRRVRNAGFTPGRVPPGRLLGFAYPERG